MLKKETGEKGGAKVKTVFFQNCYGVCETYGARLVAFSLNSGSTSLSKQYLQKKNNHRISALVETAGGGGKRIAYVERASSMRYCP